ncbi:MAG: hypothetical protein NTZ27_08390 [Ignavibacteriales bacterium]|nr:hypothetical protein [Ignavibacteriales bacterium]
MKEIEFCKSFFVKLFFTIMLVLLYHGSIFGQSAGKETKSDCWIWIDAKTGKQVPTKPRGSDVDLDGKHAFNSKSGKNYFLDDNGNWRDSKTGQSIPTTPHGSDVDLDGKHAFNPKTGQNFVRVPCPLSTTSTTPESPKVSSLTPGWSGMYLVAVSS